jgi:leader peptidase (prepilin peptidase)/N-methyltransferase
MGGKPQPSSAGCPTFAAFLFLPLRWDTNTYSLFLGFIILPSTRILATVFAALLGLAFGSFLNVCLTRWPEGESIAKPRSHCRNCGRTLAWWENIPLLSWITLRGHCRTCGAWIGIRYPLVELAMGLLWAMAVWHLVPWALDPDLPSVSIPACSVTIVGQLAFYWLLIALAVLDAENLWLPDFLTLPGIALGLGAFFLPAAIEKYGGGFYPDFPGLFQSTIERAGEILLAALLILLIRWTYKLLRKREGIGLGDAKLMAMLAAWLGLPGALLSFFIGVVFGALVALVVLALPSTRAKQASAGEDNGAAPGWSLRKLPLGTFLCIGGIVSALWGQRIIAEYLRWAGF